MGVNTRLMAMGLVLQNCEGSFAWRAAHGQIIPHASHPQPMPLEDLGRDATFFPHHSQQQMFGADMTVGQPFRLLCRIRQDPLALVGKG